MNLFNFVGCQYQTIEDFIDSIFISNGVASKSWKCICYFRRHESIEYQQPDLNVSDI